MKSSRVTQRKDKDQFRGKEQVMVGSTHEAPVTVLSATVVGFSTSTLEDIVVLPLKSPADSL